MKKSFLKYGLLSISLLLAACSSTEETPEEISPEEEPVEQPAEDATAGEEEVDGQEVTGVTIKAMYTAPHGNQSFASTFVVMDGETIFDVSLDEYQFMEGDDWEGVPNTDGGFAEGYAEELTLISKRENSDGYSAMMTDIAESTTSYEDNLDAIQDFAIGKTIAEVEDAIAELDGLGEDDDIADVVSGATFVDTNGYLQAIVDTAKDGFEFAGAEADLGNAELSASLQAPHGDKSFAIVAVLHDGENVLAAAMDELQFLDPESFDGVPNSDAAFGENYNTDVVLASKMQNDEAYSTMMADIADATMTYSESMLAIVEYAAGSTVTEIEEAADDLEGLGEDEEITDVVSGATFVDTDGYLEAITETVNQ